MTEVVTPTSAILAKTRKKVDLYFSHRNDYYQYFHIGYCKYSEPQLEVVVNEDNETKCVTIDGNYMADYLMKESEVKESKTEHLCTKTKTNHYLCRGWIRLSSNCKHFTRSKL